MLIDAESFDLAQEIEAILDGVPDDLDGQVKPELLQSVLEVATTPCANVAEAAAELADLRRCVIEIAERARPAWSAPRAPIRSPLAEDQQIVDRERYQELADELGYDRPPGADLRHPRPRRDRRRRQGDLRRRRDPPLPAAAARALLELALLARRADRDDVGADRRSSAPSRGSASRPTTAPGRSTRAGSS